MFRDSKRHDHLLGDGPHPAPQRGRHDPGDHQRRCCCRATSASPAPALCPVRGHSNVQGDRTMGIWEKPPAHFLDALQARVRLRPAARARPRHRRVDPRDARRQGATSSSALGGNFVAAAPDTAPDREGDARRRADRARLAPSSTARTSCPARTALILPTLGRTEKDLTGGREQWVTVEDSMSSVHASRGPLQPASRAPALRGRHRLRAGRRPCSATATTCRGTTSAATTPRSASRIARVVPGCEAFDEKVDQPGGFVLPHPPRDTADVPDRAGQGGLHRQPARRAARARGPAAAADAALPRPVQHHDLRPRRPLPRHLRRPARGLRAPRRHRARSASPRARSSTWSASGATASERRAADSGWWPTTSRGAARRPTTPRPTSLVPLDSTALGSNCPTSKSVIVRLEPDGERSGGEHRPRRRARPERGPQVPGRAAPPELSYSSRR